MRKLLLILFFLFFFPFLFSFSASLNVAVVAPFSSPVKKFADSFFDGLTLSLPSYVNIVKMNSNSDFIREINSVNPVSIVGPFSSKNVNLLVGKYCNKPVLIILPFARPVYDNCSNVVYFGYDPISASNQLAEYICPLNGGNIVVLYSFDKVDAADERSFVKTLSKCGKIPSVISGIPALYNVMDNFIKKLFGVVKLKRIAGLTKGRVFEHTLDVDTLIVFAPEDVFIHLVSLLDYYDIYPRRILSVNLEVDKNLLSLSYSIRKIVHFITPYYMCQNTRIGEKFLNGYRDEYYKDPSFVAALGYDIGSLLKDYYFSGKNVLSIKDARFLIGHLMFFNDKNEAVLDYKMVGYKELEKCRQEILSR